MKNLIIRKATAEDAPIILNFIIELAIYEKARHEVVASESDIVSSIFGSTSTTNAIICLLDDIPIGYAVYFFNYSTWLGKNGLYLEDLYISSEHRGAGAGKAVLKYLAQVAVKKDCARLEWSVLTWNEPAIKFYESIGAQAQNEWVGYRLTGKSLDAFASTPSM